MSLCTHGDFARDFLSRTSTLGASRAYVYLVGLWGNLDGNYIHMYSTDLEDCMWIQMDICNLEEKREKSSNESM
jgi:hypothetical protein